MPYVEFMFALKAAAQAQLGVVESHVLARGESPEAIERLLELKRIAGRG